MTPLCASEPIEEGRKGEPVVYIRIVEEDMKVAFSSVERISDLGQIIEDTFFTARTPPQIV